MSDWPGDGSPTQFTSIVDPLRDAVDHLYELRRLPEKDVPWTGLEIGQRELGGNYGAVERLTAASLRYDEEEQDRDPMRVLLGLAVQLGIEQGRRIFCNEHDLPLKIRDITIRYGGSLTSNPEA